MADDDWAHLLESERLAVDQSFANRIAESRFSRSEWGMIMTVVEFEVEHPDDPERARLVGDTSKVEGILPQLEQVRTAPAMGSPPERDEGSGGFLDSILETLGIGGSDDDAVLQAADDLVQDYAAELQDRLEREDKWERVLAAASDANLGRN